jgi:undecaprenyl-diphosphatase
MVTTAVVLLIALVAGLAFVVTGFARGSVRAPDDLLDPSGTEHWLIDRIGDHPRLAHVLAAADRRVVGGVGVAVAFVIVFLAALVVGCVLDTVGTSRGFARWDESVSRWGPDHAGTTTADVLGHLTNFGGTWYLVALLTAVGVVELVRRGTASSLLFLWTVGLGVSLVNNGLKLAVMRERPPGEHLVSAAGSSFPSGHSAAAAACWLAIALVVGRWFSPQFRPYISAAAVAIACLVATSRALLGVHWLTDVIAGVVVGWAWFIVVAIAFGGRHQELGEPVERIDQEEHWHPMNRDDSRSLA